MQAVNQFHPSSLDWKESVWRKDCNQTFLHTDCVYRYVLSYFRVQLIQPVNLAFEVIDHLNSPENLFGKSNWSWQMNQDNKDAQVFYNAISSLLSSSLPQSRIDRLKRTRKKSSRCFHGKESEIEDRDQMEFLYHLWIEQSAIQLPSGKATPCHIPTYTGISRDNSICDLSQNIPV